MLIKRLSLLLALSALQGCFPSNKSGVNGGYNGGNGNTPAPAPTPPAPAPTPPAPAPAPAPAPSPSPSPNNSGDNAGAKSSRIVAYVHLPCGYGMGLQGTICLPTPDPNVNWIEKWELDGSSPITHYILSFVSFKGGEIQSDPDPVGIWTNGGGSTENFKLMPNVGAAMKAAQSKGKKVILSLGGETGSSGFVGWWNAQGSDRVATMRAKLLAVAAKFEAQNGFALAGFDVDIELGGVYQKGSDKYKSTLDLIKAVPDNMFVAFVPQIGNGLCAAPVPGDKYSTAQALGGQCDAPQNDDRAWSLAQLDVDARKADGSPKLDYFGIQYYNAGQAQCCGGGADMDDMVGSANQNFKNLSNGWKASSDPSYDATPFGKTWPAPFPAFKGVGASRMVFGRPACNGCAGSNYVDIAKTLAGIKSLDKKLDGPMGGVLFWDLGRMFADRGAMCVGGACQPSWGGADTLQNLKALKSAMDGLSPR